MAKRVKVMLVGGPIDGTEMGIGFLHNHYTYQSLVEMSDGSVKSVDHTYALLRAEDTTIPISRNGRFVYQHVPSTVGVSQ